MATGAPPAAGPGRPTPVGSGTPAVVDAGGPADAGPGGPTGAESRPTARLAGPALLAVTAAWLPGQAHAGAVRWWLLAGVLPLVAASSSLPAGWQRAALPFVLLAGWSALSGSWAPAPGAAVHVALTQLGWAAMALVGLAWAAERRERDDPAASDRALAPWVAAAGAWAAAPALVGDAGGTFGNPSLLAGFLGPSLVLGACLAGSAGGRARAALLASVALQAMALARAGSLAGFVAPAAGLAAWLVLPPPGRARRGARVVGALVLAASLLLLPGLRAHLTGRAQLSRIALGVAAQALPFGTGAGQLPGPFLREQARRMAAGDADPALWTLATHAHDEPIHALAEGGLPGLLLLVPFALALTSRRRPGGPAGQAGQEGQEGHRGPGRTPARVTLAAAVPVMLVSLPLYEPASAALITWCVGACIGESPRASFREPLTFTSRHRSSLRVAVFSTIAIGAVLATGHLLADRLLVTGARRGSTDALTTAAALSLTPAPALRAAADRLLPEHPTRARLLADEAVARQHTPAGLLLSGRAAMAALEPVRAASRFEEAIHLHPRLFAAWLGLSIARASAGDHAGASIARDRAARLRPTDPRLRWIR